jgi:hypothetical protein
MSSPPDAASWVAWRDRLADANNPAFWPIEAVEHEIVEGRAWFLATENAALVVRRVDYPGGAMVLEALAAAGDMATLTGELLGHAENLAKEQKLTHLLVAGRQGWPRVLTDWRHYQTTILRTL